MNFSSQAKTALAAVQQAAALCEIVWSDAKDITLEKDDSSPVTVADYGAQALLCRSLLQHDPNTPIVAEESNESLLQPANQELKDKVVRYVQRFEPNATPEQVMEWLGANRNTTHTRFWVMDPIDGTRGFLRGDQYAVALALIDNGAVQIGVLGCPRLNPAIEPTLEGKGAIFVAERGKGAHMATLSKQDWRAIHVSNEFGSSQPWVEGISASTTHHKGHAKLAQHLGLAESTRVDSQAKYAIVARGQAQLYLRIPSHQHSTYRENIWDHAPGALLVQEAGGVVSNRFGEPLDLYSSPQMKANTGVIASNGVQHHSIISALQEVLSTHES